MRQILLYNLFFWISFSILAQNPYYDAIKFNNRTTRVINNKVVFDIGDTILFQNILANYLDSIPDDYLKLRELFSNNPFIGLPKLANQSIEAEKKLVFDLQPPRKLSKIGGLDVTTIADGLAKFMVERTKQELNAWFFEKFSSQMRDVTELKVLFPITSLHLEAIGSEIYNYNAYITSLRQSFEQDLSALFINLPELLDHPDYRKILDSNREVRYIIKTALYVTNQLNSNLHPGDIIHGFPDTLGIDKSPVNLYNGIKVIDLFSQSLRSKSKDRYWISHDSLKFLTDINVFRIYLGLIYQQMDSDIKFQIKQKNGTDTTVNFKDEFAEIAGSVDSISKYQQYVQEFVIKAEKTELAMKKLREPKGEKGADPTDIYTFMHASIGLIDFSTRITELPYISNQIPDSAFALTKKYIKVAENGADLYWNVTERNYGTAIANVLQILEAGFSEKLNKHPEVKGQIFKYGTFMASVVQAKTSDEVKTIIESVALPPGSFRTKRESKCNISLNSFLGFTGGWEFIKNVDINTNLEEKKQWRPNNIALSAPVGVSFTKGGIKKKDTSKKNSNKGSACGLFLSVIDIGALASFRFADDSSAVASTVKLQNIVAPGLFISYHFRNAPISLLIGWQMGPLLREVTATDFKLEDNIYYRLGFSLVVDIPLLNLYNKPE